MSDTHKFFALWAQGDAFDVDGYLANSPFEPENVWYLGELARPGAAYRHSGFKLSLGDAREMEVREQEIVAVAFLKEHEAELERLVERDDVDWVEIHKYCG